MMSRPVWFMLIALALSASAVASPADRIITGRVVSISDGDTLTVLDEQNVQHRIRLAEIDAPEVGHGTKKPGQPFGENARQSLAGICFKQFAHVEIVDTDRYGRVVGRVNCAGVDANLKQVEIGMAWAYKQYAKRPEIYAAEDRARGARIGLWSDPDPLSPWLYRKN